MAKEALGQDPFSGTVLVFRARRADRIKLVVWDGTGLVMVWKALDEGSFKWPPVSDGVMRLSSAQLAALLDGLDWTRVHPPRRVSPKAVR
ncbi:IS66 family insertion sequence element accessory protein TnpB [Phenylobacterium montanum]|uniref:IS66 family insertion sequence element accessory protein TnpB n=1 Tax=Phenylobacterium montanum TaxID=2823693 RepID=UPI002011A977|nr:IS66 family insertion sequence element accessory protein TnpB [Caulobacter sp. S6]